MAAYVIADIRVNDPVQYEEYKRLAAPTVAAHGGRYVVRGGAAETLEGDWVPERVVVLEFPSAEQAKQWWSADTYEAAKVIRRASAESRLILVEGV
jgi:uncharacterized protein (DUF1330 family)